MKNDTKKKQRYWLRKLFCPNSTLVWNKDNSITYSVLRKMVRSKEHENILKLIENETILSVREAWIDYFLEKTKPFKWKKSNQAENTKRQHQWKNLDRFQTRRRKNYASGNPQRSKRHRSSLLLAQRYKRNRIAVSGELSAVSQEWERSRALSLATAENSVKQEKRLYDFPKWLFTPQDVW